MIPNPSGAVPYLIHHLLACILVTVFASTAHGTSVRAVDMAEMLEQSALVFEGRVISLQARQDTGTGTIHTYVIFEVLDVLKGEYSNDTIELSFLGGTVGDVTMAAGDMQMPEKGVGTPPQDKETTASHERAGGRRNPGPPNLHPCLSRNL